MKVTPLALGSAGWQFRVSFDSPRKVPADDPRTTTVLLVDGKEFRASGWKASTARPHRREGVLSFPDAGASASVVEVRMQRANERSPRVFRWKGPELN